MTDYRHAIEAQCQGYTYIIREPEDLLDYALQAREVSSDLLQAFCQLHPETSQLYLRSVLNERGVKLVSRSEVVHYITKEANELTSSNLSTFSKSGFKGNGYISTGFKNPILMNASDILEILEKLRKREETSWTESHLLTFLNKKEFNQLRLLGFVTQRDDKLKLDQGIIEMFKAIGCDKSYVGLVKDFKTKQKYRNYIINVIRQNANFSFLIDLIGIANKRGMKSAENLLDICCDKDWHEPFINIFLTGRPSNGILPIYKGTDICFKCALVPHCFGCSSKNPDEIKEQLLYFRNTASIEYLDLIKRNKNIEFIKGKPAYQKFLFSYSLVVIIKGFLCNVGVLKKNKIMRKDHGKYCPKIDYWRLEDDLLV
ncbi:MAG TPA: hypothetical protein DIW17_07640 [Clostridiales bacterium]|uniref:hypothetical protein n=1 Tax=Syntrophomonas wolfei TaxID=863 RepID=UPI000EBF551F|nr:hypothetical protein [Syntrophomonas wolfei]HCS73731.1 hypothetical protein [Clostridiales bacterium]